MDQSSYGFAMPVPIQPISVPAPSSLYCGQRPMFTEDVMGMSYPSMFMSAGPQGLNQDISYDTSSKDPALVRARVFIGNISRSPINRDDLIDLFRPQGNLLALTFFKGYAFVQFSDATEADKACLSLNGQRWKGAILDVHLAMNGVNGLSKKKDDGLDTSRKRPFDECESAVMDDIAEQKKRARYLSVAESTNNGDHIPIAMADTLICSHCRFVTCSLEEFRDHRIAGCHYEKEKGEPLSLRCSACNSKYTSAWALMCHLTDFHRMMLYRVESPEEPVTQQHAGFYQSVGSVASTGDGSFNKTVVSISSLGGEDDGRYDSKRAARAPHGVIGDPIPSSAVENTNLAALLIPKLEDDPQDTIATQPPQVSSAAPMQSWNPMNGPNITSGIDIVGV